MDLSLGLDFDPDFLDFNYSAIWDPALRPGSGPRESDLYRLARQARRGDHSSQLEYVDTIKWTLREASFAVFQKTHGARPIEYADWFCAKLAQLLGILLDEELNTTGLGSLGRADRPCDNSPWEEGTGVLLGGPALLEPDVLERAFSPQERQDYDWGLLVAKVLEAGKDRLTVLRQLLEDRIAERKERCVDGRPFLGKQGAARTSNKRTRRRRPELEKRDSIIASCLSRGMDRSEICIVLDQKGMPTTENMERHGITRWEVAWADPEFRKDVQQMISKTKRRMKRVNP